MTTTLFSMKQLMEPNAQPVVMGILNTTPDSFSDGGMFQNLDIALNQVEQMVSDGAGIIDIGGESTRPGAAEVNEQEELDRVIPLIEAVKRHIDVAISIDTSKAGVMKQAVASGADIINDVRGLQNEGCLQVAAQANVPICLMHMQGLPRTMQENPQYNDVVGDIIEFFEQRIAACLAQGIKREQLIIDPGFGFGKTLEQNYQLLANLKAFKTMGLPILSGTSRKSMIGKLLNNEVEDRLIGSVTTAVIAAQQGANIIRVHDVKETVEALKIAMFTLANK